MKALIDRLEHERTLPRESLIRLMRDADDETAAYLFERAAAVKRRVYGRDVYVRGLIEFTNHCKNDCYYCGIRRGNRNADRYRLTKEEILACCAEGYRLGMRTFVLQGGEDPHFTDERLTDIVRGIKAAYPDCAVTLSVGERSFESYRALREAGADRYLLRHETADNAHYARLHPSELTLEARKNCLYRLKELGFQVGCGFMVGSPFQTLEHLATDLEFIRDFEPHMVGIGPFVPHAETPFAGYPAGSAELTIRLAAVIRLMLPNALIPATTALGTVDPRGREKALSAGANVVMPNLSPVAVRKKYALYDNKICTGEEAAECAGCLKRRIESVGQRIAVSRGDYRSV